MSIIYAVTAALSLLLLVAYFIFIKKHERWLAVLFTAIFVVNAGYLWLSVSGTLEMALWANRLSYAGSVFLPLSMMMIIMQTLKVRYPAALTKLLLAVSVIVFLVAASPGFLDIYYADVALTTVNGATDLIKVYGPWHALYYVYLGAYFVAMVTCIVWKSRKRRFEDNLYSTILAAAVLVNIGVWLMGQVIDLNFEFLAVSYIISGVFILFLKLLQAEMIKVQNDRTKFQILASAKPGNEDLIPADSEMCHAFTVGLSTLTPAEQHIYNLYLQGKGTKEVLQILDIKENTLKYHNKNIYSKLGVSGKKELVAIARATGKTEL